MHSSAASASSPYYGAAGPSGAAYLAAGSSAEGAGGSSQSLPPVYFRAAERIREFLADQLATLRPSKRWWRLCVEQQHYLRIQQARLIGLLSRRAGLKGTDPNPHAASADDLLKQAERIYGLYHRRFAKTLELLTAVGGGAAELPAVAPAPPSLSPNLRALAAHFFASHDPVIAAEVAECDQHTAAIQGSQRQYEELRREGDCWSRLVVFLAAQPGPGPFHPWNPAERGTPDHLGPIEHVNRHVAALMGEYQLALPRRVAELDRLRA